MKGILFIYTRQEAICIFNSFPLSASLLFLVLYSFWKKMIFHEIFQVDACPNLKDSLLYDRFSIHMYKARIIRYLQQFSSICDSLMPCTVHFFFWKKMIFQEIFQVGACPNLKDSLLYDRFSIHMYKARSIRYLQRFSSICDSLKPCTEKDEFLMKYFKLVHAPNR